MKLPFKNVKNHENCDFTIQCDQIRRHRVPESCAPFFRTLPPCKNSLNCNIGQHLFWGVGGWWGWVEFPIESLCGNATRNFLGPGAAGSGRTEL